MPNIRRLVASGVIGGGAKTVTIPRYFLKNAGSELDNFSNLAAWTQVDAGCAAQNNTAGEFRSGTGSIKLTASTNARITLPITPVQYPNGTRIRMYVYLYADTINNIDRFYIALRGADWTNYVQYTFAAVERSFHVGWNCLEAHLGNPSLNGAGWNTTFSLARVWLVAKAATVATASVDSMWVGLESTPSVMYCFDDGLDTIYTQAYPILKKYKGRGTFYIDTSKPNTAGCVTSAQLVEMDAAGWAIGNHSDTLDDLTVGGLTQAQIETKLNNAVTALTGWGLAKNALHLSYPSTHWNETVLAACRAAGIKTSRGGVLQADTPSLDPQGDNLLLLPADTFTSLVALAALKARVDLAITRKVLIIFYCHNILNDITPADFEELVAYIASKNLPMVTIADVYASLSGPVTVPIA